VSHWTDAHCHLQDRYLGEREIAVSASEALERAWAAGVDRVVVIGTDARSSLEALEITRLSGDVQVYATVGLHPHDALNDVEEIVALARRGHERLVGVGECGLDYFYEHSPRAAQHAAFARQIELAHELDLALVIHCRDAFDDLFDLFDEHEVPARTVIHCFTGTPLEAGACLERGCDISISGIVTFKNADSLREAARLVPLDRLHVETDSPFLAPVPHRGQPNEPAWVSAVGEFLAELRGEPVDVLRRETAKNSARLFALPAP
jgi:TatD DNase family protein